MAQSAPEYLSSTEAATYLGYSLSSLDRWVADGLVAPAWTTPGGWRKFTKTELDRFAGTLQGNGDAA